MTDTKESELESTFRKKNQWHSFKAAAYGALGMAAYMGAFMTLANGLIGVAGGTAVAASIFSPLPLLAIAALVVVGTASTYMSQQEQTELKVIQDEHLAQQNARELRNNGHALGNDIQADVGRRDGRSWQEVVSTPRSIPAQANSVTHSR
ncbi:hypothetical protein [Aeoliella sp.]|uniref:hypothetical protein n=1 Tax=Aeoliella sp. TaxID=2795800 RepID=UPI003CCC3DF9